MDLSIVSQWLARVPVRFEEPWWLLGLLTVPISMLISARSVAGMARWRRRVALAVRIVVLAALVMALAGMHVLKARDSLCILFLVDGSRSVGEVQRDLAMDFIRTATEGMRRGKDQMGIIVFGDEAHMEASPSLSPEVSRIETVLNPDQTDISQAIRLALASFPEDSAKRIVLLSDGNETLGRAIDEARVAQANDVRIDVVTLHKAYDKEVAIEQLLLPPRVKIGEPFELKVVASSLASGSGTFYVYRNKQLYGQKAVDLAPGTNVFRLRQSLDQAGFWTYDVRFVSEDDTLEENNRAMGFTHVAGAPRVLYCSMDLGADMYIPEALADGYMTVEVAGSAGVPADMSDIVNYDAIIFSDVPAMAMRTSQMELIRAACRDLGVGFMMVGGEYSFGLGGYYRTPIEETLPVTMDITHKEHFPATGLAIAVDTSGSMGAIEGGRPKIEIANEAACLAAELLTSRDQLAVISVDTMAAPVLPLSKVEEPEDIKRRIRTMRPGGGGIFCFTALRAAYDTLLSPESDSQVRHVILLSDAADTNQQEGCLELAKASLDQHGITTTVVALGRAHDTPFLQALANVGGGRFYEAMRMEDVPRIYTRETLIVARSPIVEEPFYPAVDYSAPPLKGIDWDSAPPLLGYVGATEKPTSQVYMQSPKEDPIFASWQFGLGRSLAFTSDGRNRWGAEWLAWSAFDTFWQQSVRWMLRSMEEGLLDSMVQIERGEGVITVEALGDNDEFLNNLEISAKLVTPDNVGHDLRLEQTAPGRYQQTFQARDIGPYMVNLTYESPDGRQVSQTTGAVIPYPAEYLRLEPDQFTLNRVAEVSSGRILAPEDIPELYRTRREVVRSPVPAWPALLLIVACLFVADVAVRRLVLDRSQLDAMRERLVEFKSRVRREGEPTVEAHPVLGHLLERKRGEAPTAAATTQAMPVRAATPSAAPPPTSGTPEAARLREQLAAAMARKSDAGPASAAPVPTSPEPDDGDAAEAPAAATDTFSRLMEAKRRARR
ncbi:MAG: VWA domain-containing protein [Armatimonadota bacterium]|jgi:uncharacterized membrane protein|nr:VWA domain-containing protein [Acidobacteriota bacterium]